MIVWKSRPERCTCSKAQDFWKDWDAKEEARKAAEAEQKAREEEMQRFRSMMERSGMKARFQNRRFEKKQKAMSLAEGGKSCRNI